MTDVERADRGRIFISYRRSDSGWVADALANELTKAFGDDRVFLDVRDIWAGDDFAGTLREELDRAAVLLVLIGKDWLRASDKYGRRKLDNPGDWVRMEIEAALAHPQCRVIPILIDGADLPEESDALPKEIAELLTRQRFSLRQVRSGEDIKSLSDELARGGLPRQIDPSKSALHALRCVNWEIGPLTLGAVLRGFSDQIMNAHPTESPGAHCVFDLYNENALAFSLKEIVVEVLSCQPLDFARLLSGVGATDVTRFFQVEVRPEPARYVARYVSGLRQGEYVKILSNETERFDLEIMTATEGLYEVTVHVVGAIAGNRIDATIVRRPIAFFDKNANYLIDCGQRLMPWSDYKEEMRSYGTEI
jgi:hypothetical protein